MRKADTAPAVNPYNHQSHRYDKSQPENIAFQKRFAALLRQYGAAVIGEMGDSERSLELLEGQEADAQSMLHHYRWAIGLRRKHLALRSGDMTDIHAEGPVLSFNRADSQQSLQIRANLSAEEAGGLRPGQVQIIEG